MRRALANPVVSLAVLCACQGGGPGWDDAPANADPDPTGTPELRSYKESYYAALGTTLSGTATLKDVVAECARARVVWLGDHHDDRDLHARQRELLTALCVRGAKPVLMLEAIGTQDEGIVQSYVAGQIGRTDLHRLVYERWPGSWLDHAEFDGAHYQALLDLAKDHGLMVLALEPTPRLRLEERDALMAARIRDALQRWPDRPIVVHVGSAHLLGHGDLVGKVGAPGPVIGARPSTLLQRELRALPEPAPDLVRTARGVLFFAGAVRPH